MFRRKEDTIDPDPVFPAHLKKLGYGKPAIRTEPFLTAHSFFINNVGQFRMIGAPEKEYVYHATNNERVNELRREAMQGEGTGRVALYSDLTLCRMPASGDGETPGSPRHQSHIPTRIHDDQI